MAVAIFLTLDMLILFPSMKLGMASMPAKSFKLVPSRKNEQIVEEYIRGRYRTEERDEWGSAGCEFFPVGIEVLCEGTERYQGIILCLMPNLDHLERNLTCLEFVVLCCLTQTYLPSLSKPTYCVALKSEEDLHEDIVAVKLTAFLFWHRQLIQVFFCLKEK